MKKILSSLCFLLVSCSAIASDPQINSPCPNVGDIIHKSSLYCTTSLVWKDARTAQVVLYVVHVKKDNKVIRNMTLMVPDEAKSKIMDEIKDMADTYAMLARTFGESKAKEMIAGSASRPRIALSLTPKVTDNKIITEIEFSLHQEAPEVIHVDFNQELPLEPKILFTQQISPYTIEITAKVLGRPTDNGSASNL